jgi:PhzF family phenazine biosynthesis protein
MANNLKTLVTKAAGMRAVGHSWEAIAEEVHKSVKTCQNWPSKHREMWAETFGKIERHRFEQMSKEAQTHLHGFFRDPDKKIRYRAMDLWTRHGAKAYGAGGGMVFEYAAQPKAEEKPPSKNAEIYAAGQAFMDVARERMDGERAKEGLPPLSEDEFLERHVRELDERANHKPIPVYFDENGDSCAPPGETECGPLAPRADDCSRSEQSTPADRPANRDLVFCVLFLALLWSDRAPVSRDAEAWRSGARTCQIGDVDTTPRTWHARAPLRQASASRLTGSPKPAAPTVRDLSQPVAPEDADMPAPLYLVDAFTDQPFSGNPAGVCLPAEDRDYLWMQAVAVEMNQAETAFLRRRPDGDWDLRWFTPMVEVDLCGHATLASAHVLWESKRAPASRPIRFHTKSGVLTCTSASGKIEMDFPAEPATPVAATAEEAFALGAEPTFVGRNRMDMLVVLDSPERLRQLKPDMELVAKIPVRGVIVTAKSDRPGSDFMSRFFGPQSGIAEDPVTGSSHCCLGPYWRDVLGKDELVGYQASKRGGTVAVRCVGNRVILGGTAVTVVEGALRQ